MAKAGGAAILCPTSPDGNILSLVVVKQGLPPAWQGVHHALYAQGDEAKQCAPCSRVDRPMELTAVYCCLTVNTTHFEHIDRPLWRPGDSGYEHGLGHPVDITSL